MSKANKGGYQILDLSKTHLEYDDWNEGYSIGKVYPVFKIASQSGEKPTIITSEEFEFSNRIAEEFFNIIVNTKKPILISGLTLYDETGAIDAEFKDMFVSIPPIPPIKPFQFFNLSIPLRYNYFLHISTTYSTLVGTNTGIISTIHFIINQEE